jgi:D-alanyl-D-alanine dipeptidase
MSLVEIAPPAFDLAIDLAYATSHNLAGASIDRRARCHLREAAADRLARAVSLAAILGLRFGIFDACRPTEAQWTLWNARPDPEFLADPRSSSPHFRCITVDLALIDDAGAELHMGTGFDAFTPRSHHANTEIAAAAQCNRRRLLGLMTAVGLGFCCCKWWHCRFFDAQRFPLFSDPALGRGLM